MPYGGTRNWALWVEGSERHVAHTLLGAGFLYKTESAARKGIDRLVAKGELRIDGMGRARTVGLNRLVTVGPR